MTTIQLYGRLGRAPEQRTTAAGKVMVTGSMVVNLGRDGEMPEWFSLAAFGTAGEALARHVKGDALTDGGGLTDVGSIPAPSTIPKRPERSPAFFVSRKTPIVIGVCAYPSRAAPPD